MDFWTWLTANWWIGFLFILVFGGGVATFAKHLVGQWKEVHLRKHEAELKKELIAKGCSPDEIVRVVQASAVRVSNDEENPLITQVAGDAKAELVGFLAEHQVGADGIEHIMHALNESNSADDLKSSMIAVQRMVEQQMDAEGIVRVIRAIHKAPTAEQPPAAGETAFRA